MGKRHRGREPRDAARHGTVCEGPGSRGPDLRIASPALLFELGNGGRNRVDAKRLREAVEARARGLDLFARWDAAEPPSSPPADVLARVGALYDLLPASVRGRDDDPSRIGVRAMHRALAKLGSRPP